MIKTFYMMGITCTGKDYFIELAMERCPEIFGAVQVGKEFRRRYPPGYFKGSAAPTHTEQEAIDIFKEHHAKAVESGAKIILVSGQPRRVSQVKACMDYAAGDIIWMMTPMHVIESRLSTRFANDRDSYELSLQRLVNDKLQLYDTIFEALNSGVKFKTLDTSIPEYPETIISQLAQFGDF